MLELQCSVWCTLVNDAYVKPENNSGLHTHDTLCPALSIHAKCYKRVLAVVAKIHRSIIQKKNCCC